MLCNNSSMIAERQHQSETEALQPSVTMTTRSNAHRPTASTA
jgi:hypothetical protein